MLFISAVIYIVYDCIFVFQDGHASVHLKWSAEGRCAVDDTLRSSHWGLQWRCQGSCQGKGEELHKHFLYNTCLSVLVSEVTNSFSTIRVFVLVSEVTNSFSKIPVYVLVSEVTKTKLITCISCVFTVNQNSVW